MPFGNTKKQQQPLETKVLPPKNMSPFELQQLQLEVERSSDKRMEMAQIIQYSLHPSNACNNRYLIHLLLQKYSSTTFK